MKHPCRKRPVSQILVLTSSELPFHLPRSLDQSTIIPVGFDLTATRARFAGWVAIVLPQAPLLTTGGHGKCAVSHAHTARRTERKRIQADPRHHPVAFRALPLSDRSAHPTPCLLEIDPSPAADREPSRSHVRHLRGADHAVLCYADRLKTRHLIGSCVVGTVAGATLGGRRRLAALVRHAWAPPPLAPGVDRIATRLRGAKKAVLAHGGSEEGDWFLGWSVLGLLAG